MYTLDPTTQIIRLFVLMRAVSIAEKIEPLPAEPEKERYDYQYERRGLQFVHVFEPLGSWRHVEVTSQRTAIDYAHQMKYLVDEMYPIQQLLWCMIS